MERCSTATAIGERTTSFVVEPHAAVCCDARGDTLNFVAEESAGARSSVAEAARLHPDELLGTLRRLPQLKLPRRHFVSLADVDPRRLEKILLKTYERAPADFEALLGTEGLGAKTLRALSLLSELIYGARASVRDPARFSFAHGGKDGTPFPVDRETYDRTIQVLHRALDRAKVDRSEKVRALSRLSSFQRL